MQRLARLSNVLALALLAGCVSVQHIPLESDKSDALRGRMIALSSRDLPDFTAMTAVSAGIGGLIGGAMMIEAGNKVVWENNIQDPAQSIAAAIAAELGEAFQVRVARDALFVDSDDIAKIAKDYPQADLLLDFRTINWGYTYFPTSWNRYRVFHSGRLRLIDLKRPQVLAEGLCSRMPEETPTAPTSDELLANGAQTVKDELKVAADDCVEHFRTRIFAFSEKARAPALAAGEPGPTNSTELDVEVVFWESVRNSNDPADLRAYLERYPNGTFAPLARNRLAAHARKPPLRSQVQ